MQAQLRLGAPEQVLSVPRQVDGRTLLVPLSQVASWQVTMSASDVRRYDWQKEIRLSANVDGTSMGEARRPARRWRTPSSAASSSRRF